jgi:hypothetical protein
MIYDVILFVHKLSQNAQWFENLLSENDFLNQNIDPGCLELWKRVSEWRT